MIFPTLFRFTLFPNNFCQRDGFSLANMVTDGDGGVGRSWPLAVLHADRRSPKLANGGQSIVSSPATLLAVRVLLRGAELAAEKCKHLPDRGLSGTG